MKQALVKRAILEVVGIPVGLGFALATGYLLHRDGLLVGAMELAPRLEVARGLDQEGRNGPSKDPRRR